MVLTVASRTPHHFHGSSVGYLGIAAAAAVGWIGLPGIGEATLIASGILAASGKLDIVAVLAAAWAGAVLGGIVAWLIGLKGGRPLVTAPGPFRGLRRRVVAQGERFYERFGVIAVLFTPTWIAGVARMHWTRFLPANLLSALVWALTVGLGAYVIGPAIEDVVTNFALGGSVLLGALVIGTAARQFLRRRRARV
jgi:membrane protein DedA with SNARE-associated domain